MADDVYKKFVLSNIQKARLKDQQRSGYVYEKHCENCGKDIYGKWYLCNSCYRKLVLGKG